MDKTANLFSNQFSGDLSFLDFFRKAINDALNSLIYHECYSLARCNSQ